MPSEIVAVFSPGLDQSAFIARLLQMRLPRVQRVGVLMPGEPKPLSARLYDRVVPYESIEQASTAHLAVPTGGLSTRTLLEQGDLRLGEIVMSSSGLRFFDKEWSIDQAQLAGISVPHTCLDPSEIDRYPVFFKPASEGGSGGRGIARSREELPDCPRGDLIFQEYVDSPGTYGVGFIARNGELLAHFVHFEAESFPQSGGSAIIVDRFEDERLLRHARDLLRLTDYSGWGLIEFKFCPIRDTYVFMELNAKFWASCEFAFRNEPAFGRLLFGIDAKEKPLDRMVFMGRAFRRGLGAIPLALAGLRPGSSLRFYPGWQLSLAAQLLPIGAKDRLRKFMARRKLAA